MHSKIIEFPEHPRRTKLNGNMEPKLYCVCVDSVQRSVWFRLVIVAMV